MSAPPSPASPSREVFLCLNTQKHEIIVEIDFPAYFQGDSYVLRMLVMADLT